MTNKIKTTVIALATATLLGFGAAPAQAFAPVSQSVAGITDASTTNVQEARFRGGRSFRGRGFRGSRGFRGNRGFRNRGFRSSRSFRGGSFHKKSFKKHGFHRNSFRGHGFRHGHGGFLGVR